MKHFYAITSYFSSNLETCCRKIFFSYLLCFAASFVGAQSASSVSGIITDYNGYWKTSASSMSATKPVNSHNLLAFTYNNTQYSTGVNDQELTSRGESFVAGDFWSLPLSGFSGAINPNTKIGVGEMHDGAHNGPHHSLEENIGFYLTDGIKGLNIGTGIANLPSGIMGFNVNTINPLNIGDGIPDIIVTQIADPSGSTDSYSFMDAAGNIVGHKKSMVFTHIPPVANWTADFYEASTRPFSLTPGFTNTDRPLRMWAADLSDFGITPANYAGIQRFTIDLSGQSDVAFVGYNNKSFNVVGILPVSLSDFSCKAVDVKTQLTWTTETEENTSRFTIERSADNNLFTAIADIRAGGNSSTTRQYSYTDNHPVSGVNHYRLKILDKDGSFTYSKIIMIEFANAGMSVSLYPNPSSGNLIMTHPASAHGSIKIYNANGNAVLHATAITNAQQTKLNIQSLGKGIYFAVWQNGTEKISLQLAKK